MYKGISNSMENGAMKRRNFLNSLAAAFAASPFAGHARKAVPVDEPRGEARGPELLLQESPVAGFQYHDGEAVWRRLAVGDSLRLRREPNNPYDELAVAVYWRGAKLGYVPRADNTAVAQMMDRSERLVARIERLRKSENPWRRVGICIAVQVAA